MQRFRLALHPRDLRTREDAAEHFVERLHRLRVFKHLQNRAFGRVRLAVQIFRIAYKNMPAAFDRNGRFVRKYDFRLNLTGNFDNVFDFTVLLPILRNDFASHALIFGIQFRKTFDGVRRNFYFCKACLFCLDARDAAVDELHHTSVCIVVVAVHAVGVGRAVRHQAVPPLPNGRRPHIHFVKPTGETVVQKHFSRRFKVAVVRQREQQKRRTDEARDHAITVAHDVLVENGGKFIAVLFWNDTEMQRDSLCRHRVERQPSARSNVFPANPLQ